jgi:Innexin
MDRLDEVFTSSDSERKKEIVRSFTEDYLRIDGVLLLRLIDHNTDSITTSDIATGLLEVWLEEVYRPALASALRS